MVDRVVAYVPLLANLALETLDPGAATRKITDRHGDRLPIQVCLDAARREQEVIADVSILAPEVLAFKTDLKGRDFYIPSGISRPAGSRPANSTSTLTGAGLRPAGEQR